MVSIETESTTGTERPARAQPWSMPDQVLVAALVLGAAEVPRRQVAALEVRARGAVEDDDALGEKGAETVAAGGGAHQAAMITGRSRGGNLLDRGRGGGRGAERRHEL